MLSLFKRPPDFVITKAGRDSDPYLLRWWIIPRNPIFNIYLHKILRSDDDRALHDHPWWNCSIVLKGGYQEITPAKSWEIEHARQLGWPEPKQTFRIRRAGSIVFRRATALHRLVILDHGDGDVPAWTLFITGPRIRKWGFLCPKGWVFWRDFVDGDQHGAIGKGCGE